MVIQLKSLTLFQYFKIQKFIFLTEIYFPILIPLNYYKSHLSSHLSRNGFALITFSFIVVHITTSLYKQLNTHDN